MLYWPKGVTVDTTGDIHTADKFNNRIRKIIMSTGVITTVAGDGNRKALEDNVSATSTSLFLPDDVAVDPSGNMFIAEADINRIRKVSAATGMITTIAGKGLDRLFQSRGRSASGSATDYYLYRPTGVTLDASGNVYVVDQGLNAIFKITVSSGNISIVAGTTESSGYNGDDILATTATLKGPELNVAFDASGNTYISDTYNRRIRKVTASTGMISTVAGTGAAIAWPVSADAPFNGEGGLATLAPLYVPTGVAVDVAGNLYFADYTLGVVRKVTFNGATHICYITSLSKRRTVCSSGFYSNSIHPRCSCSEAKHIYLNGSYTRCLILTLLIHINILQGLSRTFFHSHTKLFSYTFCPDTPFYNNLTEFTIDSSSTSRLIDLSLGHID